MSFRTFFQLFIIPMTITLAVLLNGCADSSKSDLGPSQPVPYVDAEGVVHVTDFDRNMHSDVAADLASLQAEENRLLELGISFDVEVTETSAETTHVVTKIDQVYFQKFLDQLKAKHQEFDYVGTTEALRSFIQASEAVLVKYPSVLNYGSELGKLRLSTKKDVAKKFLGKLKQPKSLVSY